MPRWVSNQIGSLIKKNLLRVLQKPSRVVGPSTPVSVSLMRFKYFSITTIGSLSGIKKRPLITSLAVALKVVEVALDVAVELKTLSRFEEDVEGRVCFWTFLELTEDPHLDGLARVLADHHVLDSWYGTVRFRTVPYQSFRHVVRGRTVPDWDVFVLSLLLPKLVAC